MNLTERLNVLIQSASLSQKSGTLTLNDAVKAKSAIDIISSGTLNQNFTSAINVLMELAISSQKKGAYTLKDAYMIYLAIDGFEREFQNEVNKITGTGEQVVNNEPTKQQNVSENNNENDNTIIISIPPKK
jgi:hypothetical protein